jgi:4-hydroxythreonine-4-phosphate dehydrogenase
MVLYTEKLKVIHITTHISLRQFLDTLNQPRIETVIGVADRFCAASAIRVRASRSPALTRTPGRTACLAMKRSASSPRRSPPCGRRVEVTGPCPPDTVFMQCHEGMYDMVVAMYHDQGHIPLKLLGFYDGVNITAGLPFIRTSADHGTAFDIAWTGKAKSESMATSIELAMHIAQE